MTVLPSHGWISSIAPNGFDSIWIPAVVSSQISTCPFNLLWKPSYSIVVDFKIWRPSALIHLLSEHIAVAFESKSNTIRCIQAKLAAALQRISFQAWNPLSTVIVAPFVPQRKSEAAKLPPTSFVVLLRCSLMLVWILSIPSLALPTTIGSILYSSVIHSHLSWSKHFRLLSKNEKKREDDDEWSFHLCNFLYFQKNNNRNFWNN